LAGNLIFSIYIQYRIRFGVVLLYTPMVRIGDLPNEIIAMILAHTRGHKLRSEARTVCAIWRDLLPETDIRKFVDAGEAVLTALEYVDVRIVNAMREFIDTIKYIRKRAHERTGEHTGESSDGGVDTSAGGIALRLLFQRSYTEVKALTKDGVRKSVRLRTYEGTPPILKLRRGHMYQYSLAKKYNPTEAPWIYASGLWIAVFSLRVYSVVNNAEFSRARYDRVVRVLRALARAGVPTIRVCMNDRYLGLKWDGADGWTVCLR
jgi:hypothetical protein